MNISAHEANNMFYDNAANTPWALGWTCQSNVTSTIVTKTGGTYATKAPEAPEKPKKAAKTKK